MHFFPDTSEADAAAESFWPESFKQVIRKDFRQHIGARLEDGTLKRVYRGTYSGDYPDAGKFMERVADMVTIGAENGADAAFDDIYTAFLTESPLPRLRRYYTPLLPAAFPSRLRRRIHRAVFDEYRRERVYRYAYRVGYKGSYPGFRAFMDKVAELVVAGIMKGADDMVAGIYRSFLEKSPLPPARRNPKRLKSW